MKKEDRKIMTVYNKGTRCMGIFNTDPCKFYMFNKPVASEIPWWEWLNRLPDFLVQRSDSFTKPAKWKTPLESFKEASKKADWKEQFNKLLDLPNFDYDIFESITGISYKMLSDSIKYWTKHHGNKAKRRG